MNTTKRKCKWPEVNGRRQRVLVSLEKKQREFDAIGTPMSKQDLDTMAVLRDRIKNDAGKKPKKKIKIEKGAVVPIQEERERFIGVWTVSIVQKKKKERYKKSKDGKKIKTKKTFQKSLTGKTYSSRTYTIPQVRAMFKSNNRTRYVIKFLP